MKHASARRSTSRRDVGRVLHSDEKVDADGETAGQGEEDRPLAVRRHGTYGHVFQSIVDSSSVEVLHSTL